MLFRQRGAKREVAPGEVLREYHRRSIAKAISWRLMGTLDTMIISFVVTRRFSLAFSIGFIELFTKTFLFYLHERLWNRISFGRARLGRDYEI